MFDHHMNATIIFNPCVTVNAALDALKPMMDYFDWEREHVEEDGSFDGGDFVNIVKDGESIVSMTIYTSGEVTYAYKEVLGEFASNLATIAQPEYLKLNNHDTDQVTKFWYGEQHAIAEAKKAHAWRDAASELRNAGVSESMLNLFQACLKYGSSITVVKNAQKVEMADDANRFFSECETVFGSLSEISKEFGNDTLRDLFYLHSAILSGSYVEHFKNDSQLLEVIEQLPSKEKWLRSIQQA